MSVRLPVGHRPWLVREEQTWNMSAPPSPALPLLNDAHSGVSGYTLDSVLAPVLPCWRHHVDLICYGSHSLWFSSPGTWQRDDNMVNRHSARCRHFSSSSLEDADLEDADENRPGVWDPLAV